MSSAAAAVTPTRSPAWSRAGWFGAWLGCTIATITLIASPRTTPIDTDEIYWIGSAYYYHLAFEAPDWKHPAWQLLPARENPPVAKYLIGAGIGVSGHHVGAIDLLGGFYAYYEANLGRHPALGSHAATRDSVQALMSPELRQLVARTRAMYVAPDLLLAGRRVALVCGAVASLLLFVLGSSQFDRATGLLASQLLLVHPAIVAAYGHAMADAPALMLGLAAALATWSFYRRSHAVHFSGHREPLTGHSERREESPVRDGLREGTAGPGHGAGRVHLLGSALLAGALIGLAAAAKMNWLIVAFLFAAVTGFLIVESLRRGDRAMALRALGLGAAGLACSLAVFIVVNPAIVRDPVEGLISVVREPRTTTMIQSRILPNPPYLATPDARLAALARLVAGSPAIFAIAVAATAAVCYRTRRRATWFVAGWWALAFLLVMAWLPFEWKRYVVPLVVPSVVLAAHAIVAAIGALVARSARRPARA